KLASKDFRDSGITNISLEEEKGFLPSSHIITVVGQKKDEDGKAKFDASSLEKSDIKLYRYVHEEKKGFAEGNLKVAMKLIDEQTKEEYVKAQFKDHKELSPQLGTILNMLQNNPYVAAGHLVFYINKEGVAIPSIMSKFATKGDLENAVAVGI